LGGLVDRGYDRRKKSEGTWEKLRFRIGVRWLWIEKHGRDLLSRSEPITRSNAKGRRTSVYITASFSYTALVSA